VWGGGGGHQVNISSRRMALPSFSVQVSILMRYFVPHRKHFLIEGKLLGPLYLSFKRLKRGTNLIWKRDYGTLKN
jgi:hypothetical protein